MLTNAEAATPFWWRATSDALARYLLPPFLVVIATILSFQIGRIGGVEPPYALFYVAVAICAWYGGLWPGLLATLLSGMAIDYYIQEPRFSFVIRSVPEALRLLAFAVVALVIGLLQTRARTAAVRAREGELRAEHLASIVASSHDAILGLALDGRITSWNAGAERLLGYPASQVMGRPVAELALDPEQADLSRAIAQLAEGDHLGHYEALWQSQGGQAMAMSVTLSPVRDATGRVVGASAVARDVTRRNQADEAYARLAAVVAASTEAIVGADADGVITSWNPGAGQLFGYHATEVTGKPFLELLPPASLETWTETLDRVRAGSEEVRVTLALRNSVGESVEMDVAICPIQGTPGTILGFSLVGRKPAPEGGGPRWQAVTDVARAWRDGRSPDRVLSFLTAAAAGAIAADNCSVLAVDTATGQLVLPTGERVTPTGAAARAIASRQAVVVNDYATATGATAEATAAGVQAAVSVPTLAAGAVVGLLQATTNRKGHRFAAEDAELLDILAPIAADCLQSLRGRTA